MDWDDAYNNSKHIEGGSEWVNMWRSKSAQFREALDDSRQKLGESYGNHPREKFDMFFPEVTAKGVVVFLHGGYWHSLNHELWSHLAAGPMAHGWAVAMPSYPLCPEVSIQDIVKSLPSAIGRIGDLFDEEFIICGHSAGGHLAARLACDDIYVPNHAYIRRFVSISGVHDLRPLTKTELNVDLKLDMASAAAESPALLTPREGIELLAWVGAEERPEFLRQNDLIANAWKGAFAKTGSFRAPGHNHFTVIGDLADPKSDLTKALVS